MRAVVIIVFVVVYAAMILGRLPGLALDRAGAAVLGALALIAAGTMTVTDAWAAADVPTLALLFGLMVISAQLRLGGFYTAISRALIAASAGPAGLLARVMAAAATLSALLANDIVCLAMTPILVEATLARGLNPVPYLIGLAMAANIGSAATLIGNPQNMLIGQVANLPFGGYMLAALPSVVAGLAIAFAAVVWGFRGRFAGPKVTLDVPAPAYSPWQSAKGLAALTVCMIVFVWGGMARENVALGCAGALLLSRRMASRETLALVDWQLLLLFLGLFVVNREVAAVGLLDDLYRGVAACGVDLGRPAWLFTASVVLSNIVSNVPAVMLLLPGHGSPEQATLLAVSSTLAGNLLLPGSIANLIVADQAALLGVSMGFREHARIAAPATVLTLVVSGWLLLGV
ncbi:SLC13 family permease [Solidesulfovibrio magneticus]|uniref:Arsenical pump membrane protein n=1 Tax=Solidesulfovibrio magneticus (strain ATCC 700980 / DSM 13731 / RS-1) TaxID=573370 RepID=C4XS90_SOLM1|nr:SLC13 family permease [Solidesulfovibrio magneticus]BAH75612.1 putative arsenical pump membrane protein [Solidesulfovibrio magneticus RS-1]